MTLTSVIAGSERSEPDPQSPRPEYLCKRSPQHFRCYPLRVAADAALLCGQADHTTPYGEIEWSIPHLTVDQHGRIVKIGTNQTAIEGTKAIYITPDTDNDGIPEIALKLCNTTADNKKGNIISECSGNTYSSGLKIADGGLGINIDNASGLYIGADNILRVNVRGVNNENTGGSDEIGPCPAHKPLLSWQSVNGQYTFVCTDAAGQSSAMSNFLVSNNFDNGALTLNSDRRNTQTMADESQVDFAGTSYNNSTNKSSNSELNTTNTTNYNNIEVTHNNDKNGYAAFNFNLGTTGVVDGNTDATKGTGQNAANGTKTVQGAAGNHSVNYTSSGNNQTIRYYVPTLTVDKYGRLTNVGTTNAWNLNAGVGLGMDASGNIIINDNLSNGLTFLNGGDTLYVHLRDNNSGSIGGLMISNDELQINAPVCTDSSGGRLMWSPNNTFTCQKITTSSPGTYGANTIEIPVITIDSNGEIRLGRTNVSGGDAVTISGGVISVALGDGLTTTPNPSTGKSEISIKYSEDGGLTIINGTGQLSLRSCPKDNVLKNDGGTAWRCAEDNDTIKNLTSYSNGSVADYNWWRIDYPDTTGAFKSSQFFVNIDLTVTPADATGWYDAGDFCVPSGGSGRKAYAITTSIEAGGSNKADGVALRQGSGVTPCYVSEGDFTGLGNQPGVKMGLLVHATGPSSDVDVGLSYITR